MNIWDRLRGRREAEPVNSNRRGRRAQGHRGRYYVRRPAETFVPRYIRRHYTEVMAVDWHSRIWRQGRRERRVRARIMRLDAKYGLV